MTPTQQLFLDTDWARTGLGVPDDWSPALRAAISSAMTSRFPMLVMAGPELAMVYNDGYATMMGARHPAMGRPLQEVWSDVWPSIGPMVDEVRGRQQATYVEDLRLVMGRNGFAEETYFTFSYSPLLDADGAVVGLLDTAIETTGRVLTARRLELTQRLESVVGTPFADVDAAAAAVLDVLATQRIDCPLVSVLLLADPDDPDSELRLSGSYGARHPDQLLSGLPEGGQRAVRGVLRGEVMRVSGVSEWGAGVDPAPAEVGGGAVQQAVLLPLTPPGRARPIGVLVAGASPHLHMDAGHQSFFAMLASRLAAVLGEALTRRTEQVQSSVARTMAAALQRSLLTEPVQPDHLQIIARYLPAAREAQIGGDWHDAFQCRDGSTWLVVGDVAGHDHTAAATMAQVRNVLRGIAYTLESSPAQVLSAVDAAMSGLGEHALTTVVAMRVEQAPEDMAAGRRRIRWSNAGHPPPVLISATGTEALAPRPDLLLGIDPTVVRTDHERVLHEEDTVLLYTDGLVERRDRDLDAGTEWLLAATRSWAGTSLDELCDQLLADVAHHAEDDVALLALRARPQGGPRSTGGIPQGLVGD